MLNIPKDHKKIKAQIHRYERALKKELDEYGCYDDGAGKRYMIGPLYLILGDVAGAMKSYKAGNGPPGRHRIGQTVPVPDPES